ncbi:MAG TPA: hypothetical protein VMJ10_30685 [Kofleriaceae bacterium]|nr:hypothetical protein [Kofleriaceae bacterium]
MKHVVIALMLAVVARAAYADDKPWAAGVPQATQDKANALFAEANQLFAEQAHAAALDKYRAAIALWDHPLIRFNLAVTLIRLDRILEAADELDSALRYDEKPFSKELYQQALDYRKLLNGRVGDLEVTCDQAGAHIQLDGKPWFECPGTKKQRLLAGEHILVGDHAGDLTSSERVVVAGGGTVTKHVKLVPLDAAIVYHYPMQRWLPWTVGGAGVAIAATGVAVWLAGRSQLDQFYNDVATTCPNGCKLDSEPLLHNEESSALFKGKLGVGLMVGGGAAAAVGAVLVILNRPTRFLPNVEVQPTQGGIAAGWLGHF